MTKIRELREKRVRISEEARRILNQEKITTEDKRKFDLMMTESDQLKAEIDRLEGQEQLNSLDRELRETQRPPEAAIRDDGYGGALDSARERREKRAFANYLRFGAQGLSEEDRSLLRRAESREMDIGTTTAGGFFVPQGFVYDVEVALKYYGNMLGVSKMLNTATGQPLPYPTSNDVSNTGAIIGEGVQVTEQDVTIGQIMLGAYKFTTKMVQVSLELLQDSAFDMETFLKDQFAIRLGRCLNTYFTTGAGSGSSQPMGIMTAATAGPTAVGSAANTGGTQDGSNSIGYIDLVELEHSVDPLYRRGAKFMMNDLTLKAIKEILDKYGRPLWVPGVATNAPDTILGYEYSINNDMATIAASANTVAFGRLDKYLIRQVKELAVLRLVERFADYGQVAFLGFARYDGNLLDAGTHPVKYLVQAAS